MQSLQTFVSVVDEKRNFSALDKIQSQKSIGKKSVKLTTRQVFLKVNLEAKSNWYVSLHSKEGLFCSLDLWNSSPFLLVITRKPPKTKKSSRLQ